MKKLNLQWVTESIGTKYKDWKKGDIVLISAQTGTGKTYFIKNELMDNIGENERILLVCNRTNLKRQTKRDILRKFNLEVPELLNDLDEVTTINDKITITSYHAISNTTKENIYDKDSQSVDFSFYDYIVFDECHFIFSDSSFNNKNRFVYDKVVRQMQPHAVKIFISATIEEVRDPIIRCVEKAVAFGNKPTIHEYTTGNDYSYVSAKYFKEIQTIINLIKNDKSDDKWLIFISNIDRDAKPIIEEIGEDNCSLIKSGTQSDELNSIINNSRFTKKVLICTKAMDNGININDKKLKNIVIMTWDRVSFIQMLGRKRINIDAPEEVNLFIPTRFKKSFKTKLQGHLIKKKEIDLLQYNDSEFYKKYDNDLKEFNKVNDIFYRDNEKGTIRINMAGWKRLYEDIKFTEHMVERFESDKDYAFIHEQLEWLGLDYTFSKSNLIEDVIVDDEVESLASHLESIVDKKLFSEDQQKLSDLIIRELITLSNDVDYRTKKLKPSTLETIIRTQLMMLV